jgi:hypothetical protein
MGMDSSEIRLTDLINLFPISDTGTKYSGLQAPLSRESLLTILFGCSYSEG